MARYVVQVFAPDGRMTSLLVVLSPDQLCAALRDKIKRRLLGINPAFASSNVDITLHLNAVDGPLLDTEDLLCDILPDDKDVVYAAISHNSTTAEANTPTSLPALLQGAGQSSTGEVIRVRVITPELAQSQPNLSAIPLLPEQAVTFKSTLKELHDEVKNHLGLATDIDHPWAELRNFRCNCSLARQIEERAPITERGLDDGNALNTLVVVYGNNEVACISVRYPTQASLERALMEHIPTETAANKSTIVGGVQPEGNEHYLKLPVVALCVPSRHSQKEEEQDLHSSIQWTTLDINSSEMPIHLTAHNCDKTLAAAGLGDSMVNGVLNIYAVTRMTSDSMQHSEFSKRGQHAIYRQDLAWNHPLGQSERGLANFLCSLRLFTSLTHARSMEESEQDAVFYLIMLLTKFPPAVRAIYILMRGETPHASERAAIVQNMYEVLKLIVPLQVIGSDPKRLLEGSRLLFGLVLEKAKHLKCPYVAERVSCLTWALSKCMSFAILPPWRLSPNPVQLLSGLVDRGFLDAFGENGPLHGLNDINTTQAPSVDQKLLRACLLCGVAHSTVVAFDIDAVNTIIRYSDHGNLARLIAASEYSDLHYLSKLCSCNKLGVAYPSTLPSADPPVLTLDRVGYLAMYTGRQACGQAGRDINLFRPTSSVIEEAVDVSIITHLLVSILERRNVNGTAIFESFGDHTRQVKEPDEIVMVCVDASASMDDGCDFIDVEESKSEDEDDTRMRPNAQSDEFDGSGVENPAFDRPAVDDLKEYLSKHVSFDDFLAVIQSGTDDYHQNQNAEKILKILLQLTEQEVQEHTRELEDARRGSTTYHFRQKFAALQHEVETLKNRNLWLHRYKEVLVAFLLYRARNCVLDEPLTWRVGQDVPPVPKCSPTPTQISLGFKIPAEFLCPISTEIMEDPVVTVDGFTYERRNIERWFQTHETSPCTNLVLDSFDLRPIFTLKQEIRDWIDGRDIISNYSSSNITAVSLKLPLGTITTRLPSSTTMEDIYQVAFRLSRGRYSSFVLSHCNTILIPSEESAVAYINPKEAVVLSTDDSVAKSATHDGVEDLCLVKIYLTFTEPAFSYWEPKTTTKTLASVIFRYYRHQFRVKPWQVISKTPTIWTDVTYNGDQHYNGTPRKHRAQLSDFFVREHAFGRLAKEALCVQEEVQELHTTTQHESQQIVLKIYLGSAHKRHKHTSLTRIQVLKQMFEGYINRLLAYGYQTHLGLVTFRSTASLTQEITHAVENFRHQLNNIRASGDVKDTKSNQRVHNVALGLIRDRVVVDSFCLDSKDNLELQALSYLTGEYKFLPSQMEHAMAICEMEPVLSGLERPDVVLPDAAKRFHSNPLVHFGQAKSLVKVDEVTRDNFHQRKEHDLLSETYIELGHFARGFSMANRSDGNLRLARIHNEIRNCGAKPHPHYDIYICESNFTMWKIVMQGPPESTYANGTFLMYIEMGDDYPTFAPKGRFLTPIYHPNINRHGRVCHSIFDRNWTVDTTSKDIIDTLYSLLLVPEFSDPINTILTLGFHWDEVQFKEEARRHIAKHASKDRFQWKREITST